ncbi:hypothetical protein HDU83_007583 [Entophlyctis luteolus]|nr:hypothetical protein HDU82_008780 [Entophlyctis luteolus]KAJ3339555.1 hypothetical protein HDU83_007583 [Entophlyctis luteolus]KAJ3378077.1 hypothetical protein HDU84_007966 [Entophlyctis sp. JEL0112]
MLLNAATAAAFAALGLGLISRVAAFTNGTLIPPYICDLDDLAAGGPKSLGDIIPLLVEDDAQAKIAGYHHVTGTNYSAQNLCTAAFSNGAAYSATSNNIIVSTLGGEALVGLIVWMQDYPTGSTLPRRIGTFTSAGLNMMLYPYQCGQTIVHTTALNDDAKVKTQSDVIVWTPPVCGVYGTFVEVRGVCITDKGYGKFQIQLPTNNVGSVAAIGCVDCTPVQTCTPQAAATTIPPAAVVPSTSTTTVKNLNASGYKLAVSGLAGLVAVVLAL